MKLTEYLGHHPYAEAIIDILSDDEDEIISLKLFCEWSESINKPTLNGTYIIEKATTTNVNGSEGEVARRLISKYSNLNIIPLTAVCRNLSCHKSPSTVDENHKLVTSVAIKNENHLWTNWSTKRKYLRHASLIIAKHPKKVNSLITRKLVEEQIKIIQHLLKKNKISAATGRRGNTSSKAGESRRSKCSATERSQTRNGVGEMRDYDCSR